LLEYKLIPESNHQLKLLIELVPKYGIRATTRS